MPAWAKKIIIVLVIAVVMATALPASAGLFDDLSKDPCDACEFAKLLGNIRNLAISITGPITVLIIIVGGVMITVSAGNEQLRTQGKKTVIGGVIGLVIVILAWAIVAGILTAILGTDIGDTFWTVACPEDTTCEIDDTGGGGDDDDDDEPAEEFGGTLSGSRAGASSSLLEFLNCFDDYIPKGENWIITSVTDNSHPTCRPNNNGNPLGCDTSQCSCGGGGKHCPDQSCNSCSSYCSHALNSCHYGGSCTDGSYAIDMDRTTSPPRVSDVRYAASQCGDGAYVLRHGAGNNDHVHMSIGRYQGNNCNCN